MLPFLQMSQYTLPVTTALKGLCCPYLCEGESYLYGDGGGDSYLYGGGGGESYLYVGGGGGDSYLYGGGLYV